MLDKNIDFSNIRIEDFGSSQYLFDDIILRDRKQTGIFLEDVKKRKLFDKDIGVFWKKEEKESSILDLRLPFILQLEYTYQCPLRCKYCYSASDPKRNEKMPFDKFKDLVRKISEEDIFDLYVLGGEPFTLPEYLKYLISNVSGKYITISTNAVLIKENHLEWLVNEKNKVSVSVGIDGSEEKIHNATRGGFSEMYKSIKMLNNAKIPLLATSCITNYNILTIEDTIKFLIDNNFRSIQLLPVGVEHLSQETIDQLTFKIGDPRKYLGELRDKYQDKIKFDISFKIPGERMMQQDNKIPFGPCTAGVTSAGISVAGNLIVCPPVQHFQIPIKTNIQESFLMLKDEINKIRHLKEGEVISINQACGILGYGQKCAYTR